MSNVWKVVIGIIIIILLGICIWLYIDRNNVKDENIDLLIQLQERDSLIQVEKDLYKKKGMFVTEEQLKEIAHRYADTLSTLHEIIDNYEINGVVMIKTIVKIDSFHVPPDTVIIGSTGNVYAETKINSIYI